MRLLFIGTSRQKTKNFISKKILDEDMTYETEELSSKQQSGLFRKAFTSDNTDLKTINNNLTYGYINISENNSEI